MKLMILDGNSIVNRAFYGVRMLNAPGRDAQQCRLRLYGHIAAAFGGAEARGRVRGF